MDADILRQIFWTCIGLIGVFILSIPIIFVISVGSFVVKQNNTPPETNGGSDE